jgi:hypothetical protein
MFEETKVPSPSPEQDEFSEEDIITSDSSSSSKSIARSSTALPACRPITFHSSPLVVLNDERWAGVL